MNNAFPSLSAWPKFFGVMRESPFAGQSLDRKTQKQIVKEHGRFLQVLP